MNGELQCHLELKSNLQLSASGLHFPPLIILQQHIMWLYNFSIRPFFFAAWQAAIEEFGWNVCQLEMKLGLRITAVQTAHDYKGHGVQNLDDDFITSTGTQKQFSFTRRDEVKIIQCVSCWTLYAENDIFVWRKRVCLHANTSIKEEEKSITYIISSTKQKNLKLNQCHAAEKVQTHQSRHIAWRTIIDRTIIHSLCWLRAALLRFWWLYRVIYTSRSVLFDL